MIYCITCNHLAFDKIMLSHHRGCTIQPVGGFPEARLLSDYHKVVFKDLLDNDYLDMNKLKPSEIVVIIRELKFLGIIYSDIEL